MDLCSVVQPPEKQPLCFLKNLCPVHFFISFAHTAHDLLPNYAPQGRNRPAPLLHLKMPPQHLSLPLCHQTTPYPPPHSIHLSTLATGGKCFHQTFPGENI